MHRLEEDEPPLVFELGDLHRQVHAFGFVAGYQTQSIAEQDPVNVKAVRIMACLHLKVIRSLFLDDLETDLASARGDRRKLDRFRRRLGDVRIIDPACGCGNFLVVAYRELRRLEIEALTAMYVGRQREQFLDLRQQMRVDVDQMYGIEIQEWPVRIAETALWLMDHQMNQLASQTFGEYVVRLPLEKSPTVRHANALRIDWNEVLPAGQCT